MKIIKVKSGSPYEDIESYSRVVTVGEWVMVSNTAGVDYATQVFPKDAAGQTRQALRNIRGALEAVGSGLEDIVRSRVTIPNLDDAQSVMREIGDALRGIDPASTVTCSPLGGPQYLVEIEVTAYRGAGAETQNRMTIAL